MIWKILIKYLCAILIISFVLWTRFVRDRANSKLFFNIPVEIYIILNTFLITYFCFIFYKNIKEILGIKKQISFFQIKLIKKIINIIEEYIIKSPDLLYTEITKNINMRFILEKPASYFTAYCYYPKTIILLFLELPLIIVSTAFLIEIIYYNKLYYFYISLLFLIPVFFMQLWLFIVETYSKRRLDHLALFLNIFYIKNENRYQIMLKPDDQLPIDDTFTIPQIKEKFVVFCDFWQIYSKIFSFMKHLESYRKKYHPYIQIYTSFCYIISWSFVLYFTIS